MGLHLRIAASLAVACAVACTSVESTAMEEKPFGSWELVELGGTPPELREGQEAPSLDLGEGGTLSGYAGVNRFNGTLDLDALREGTFATTPLISTRMAGPPEAMALEMRVFQMLEQVNALSCEDGTLTLFDGDTALAVYRRS